MGQAPGELSQVSSQIGAGLLAGSAVAGPAAPFLAAAGGIADLVGAVSKLFQGCGTTCTEATTIVNQVEPYLQQNNQIYFSNPNRTTADQANALATAQQIFQIVEQGCGNAALGVAGQNCISGRLGNGMNQGSSTCVFGETTENEYPAYSSVPYPVGVCWTWVLAYYDPILQDVPPGDSGPATATTSTSALLGSTTGTTDSTDYLPLLLLAAVVVGVMLL